MAWLFLHIMKLAGFRSRPGVLLEWAWAGFTYQRSVRLITGDGEGGGRQSRHERAQRPRE